MVDHVPEKNIDAYFVTYQLHNGRHEDKQSQTNNVHRNHESDDNGLNDFSCFGREGVLECLRVVRTIKPTVKILVGKMNNQVGTLNIDR